MANGVEANRAETLSVGAVLSRTFGVIGGNPVVTLGSAFLLAALPAELLGLATRATIADGLAQFEPTAILAYVGSLLLILVTSLLVQATIIRAAAAQATGHRAGFAECIMASLANILPLLLLGILMALGVALGMVLLFVPGIILIIVWSVASSALVMENLGPLEALGRSRELTKGSRWKIFGLGLVMIVGIWALTAALGGIAIVVMGFDGLTSLATSLEAQDVPIGLTLFSLAINTLSTAFFSALPACLYVSLRELREGPQIDQLADMFA